MAVNFDIDIRLIPGEGMIGSFALLGILDFVHVPMRFLLFQPLANRVGLYVGTVTVFVGKDVFQVIQTT